MDNSRRKFIKTIAQGVTYSTPAIMSIAAPENLMAQGPSMAMMMTFCDYFPTICEIFGWNSQAAMTSSPRMQSTMNSPTPPPPRAPSPGSNPPPGKRAI